MFEILRVDCTVFLYLRSMRYYFSMYWGGGGGGSGGGGGGSGSAIVLGKLLVPGVLLLRKIVRRGPTALLIGAGGGYWDIFSLFYLLSLLSPALWETARYRPKYCLKGLVNPKQPTKISMYSRTSVARTLMAYLPRLFQTRS